MSSLARSLLWWRGLSHEVLIEPGDGAPDGINLVLAFDEIHGE